MCQAVVAQLQRGGLLTEIQVSPLQAAPWASPDLWERGRSEVLLVDTQSAQVWGGVDALRQLLSRRAGFKLLSQVLNWPIFHALAQGFYKTLAYNRRILSPRSPNAIACACDPPPNIEATRQFYTLLISLILLSLLAFIQGLSNSPAHLVHSNPWSLFNAITTASVVGWLGTALTLKIILKPQARLILPQTLVSLTRGSLYLLLGGLLLLWLRPNTGSSWLGGFGLLGLGLGMQALGSMPALLRRMHTIGAPSWSPWLWLVIYLGGALGCLWLSLPLH